MEERILRLEDRLRKFDLHTHRHFDQLHDHIDAIAKTASDGKEHRLGQVFDRINTMSRRVHNLHTLMSHTASLYTTTNKKVDELIKKKQHDDISALLQLVFTMLDKINTSEPVCCICRENTRNCALIPCGHHTFCSTCVEQIHNDRTMRSSRAGQNTCPLCRCPIEQTLILQG